MICRRCYARFATREPRGRHAPPRTGTPAGGRDLTEFRQESPRKQRHIVEAFAKRWQFDIEQPRHAYKVWFPGKYRFNVTLAAEQRRTNQTNISGRVRACQV